MWNDCMNCKTIALYQSLWPQIILSLFSACLCAQSWTSTVWRTGLTCVVGSLATTPRCFAVKPCGIPTPMWFYLLLPSCLGSSSSTAGKRRSGWTKSVRQQTKKKIPWKYLKKKSHRFKAADCANEDVFLFQPPPLRILRLRRLVLRPITQGDTRRPDEPCWCPSSPSPSSSCWSTAAWAPPFRPSTTPTDGEWGGNQSLSQHWWSEELSWIFMSTLVTWLDSSQTGVANLRTWDALD